MFWRWFAGAYGTAVLIGFFAMPWVFAQTPVPMPWVLGAFFIPAAVPFAAAGALTGLGLQWGLNRLMRPGWQMTAVLGLLTALAGGLGMHLVSRSTPYVINGLFSALVATLLAQHDESWRRAWLVILAGGALGCLTVIASVA
ncbi:MAG TPA: hypothetical protein VNT75_14805 [Symbiobacteriaceae bacterium]|nr:hypothetical protein [Symbiobacteriaceae bacterium]